MSISASDESERPVNGQRTAIFGQALREWRSAEGLTVKEACDRMADISALCPGERAWQRWETGERVPTGAYRRALAQVMGLSVAELVRLIEDGPATSDTGRMPAEEVDHTRRRQFLSGLGATIAGVSGIPGIQGVDVERLVLAGADAAWLRDAEEVIRAIASIRSNVAPGSLAPAVLGHLSGLEDRLPDSAELTAQTSVLAGSLLVKAGRLGQAWRCYSSALQLSRDVTVKAKALNGMAGVYVRHGVRDVPVGAVGPAPDIAKALELQEQAADLVRHHDRASAGIMARLGEMRAEAGDDTGAMRALDVAARQIGYDGYQWFYLSPDDSYQLDAYLGRALALLGRNAEAVVQYDRVLKVMPVEMVDWRGTIEQDREAALAAL